MRDPLGSAMTPKRHQRLRKLAKDLHHLIDAWDPVGLLKTGAPTDEYECLVGPILTRLERGEPSAQLATWLQAHIADHFGVPSTDARAFAEKACAWHRGQLTAR
jgi:hypothetical protein